MKKHDRKRRARKRQKKALSAKVYRPPLELESPEPEADDDPYALVGAPHKPRTPPRVAAVAVEPPCEPEMEEAPTLRFIRR
jgi:hypothetical protein